MLAVIRTGGKQYRVGTGDVLAVEKLGVEPGQKYIFDDVLMIADGDKTTLGDDLQGAVVEAELLSPRRSKKIVIWKSRQRNTYRRRKGHRQQLDAVRITAILPAS